MFLTQVSRPVAVVLAFGFVFIICFGGVANALVLMTHIKYHKELLKDSKDILIFSLALGDFVASSLLTPLAFSSAIAKHWTTGSNGCVFYGLVTTWMGLSSILQLTCIAVERYHALSRLEIPNNRRKRAIQMIPTCWLAALAASGLPLFGFSQFTLEDYGLHCSIIWNKSHVWYCMSLLHIFYLLPLITIGVSYIKLFLVVRKVYQNTAATWGANAKVTRQSFLAQVKFTKQLVVVTCGFLLAWTPYAVLSSLRVLTDIEFNNGWYEMPALFAKTAYLYNPVIYFFMYRRLRRRVVVMWNEIMKKIQS